MNTCMSLFDAITVADVRAALAAGADIEQRDAAGRTPLVAALRKGHAEVARALIKANACINVKTAVNTTALHYAAGHGDLSSVSELLAAGADVNARSYSGHTPLTWARGPAVVAVLVSGGADTEARNHNGKTPLESFMLWRTWDRALALIELGACVSDPRLLFLLLE